MSEYKEELRSEDVLLKIRGLRTTFTGRNERIEAVRNVDMILYRGEIVGIVGESGCGKSVMMKSILGTLPGSAAITGGEILFDGKHMERLSDEEKRKLRGKEISMIFQDPMTALNPLRKIGFHIEEVLKRNTGLGKTEARQRAVELLRQVGIPSPEKRIEQYPHEFSGGMRQRVLIAMAISSRPKLLIADEPTTALDVTIQAQILKLLKGLNRDNDMSILLISHDLGVVASVCNRIQVMYAGMIMEEGTTEEIFYTPKHQYTKALLNSIPSSETEDRHRLYSIKGSAPLLNTPAIGCPFADRCEIAIEHCFKSMPEYKDFSKTHRAMCFLSEAGGGN
jgi:oligopeptide/dipeptide ABC transporter ATP-binding protein